MWCLQMNIPQYLSEPTSLKMEHSLHFSSCQFCFPEGSLEKHSEEGHLNQQHPSQSSSNAETAQKKWIYIKKHLINEQKQHWRTHAPTWAVFMHLNASCTFILVSNTWKCKKHVSTNIRHSLHVFCKWLVIWHNNTQLKPVAFLYQPLFFKNQPFL